MTTASPRFKRPEVLAPAGEARALEAAVRAGADAVYFGLSAFNARARATNFDEKELEKTLRTLHQHGVRGYVTLNTLVFDHELARMEETIRACAEAGADAVIVQDLGVAELVRAIAPDLPLHASTQMTCTDAGSVELARTLGARRVIVARELSLDDLRQIRRMTDVELEVFVHGALCIAYSGQCLTSEAIGGRSANRGACAQACRLPYELVVDGVLRELGDKAYLLSPEDLEASALVPELVELGIASLKIEGRLKGPEYVAATTALYRRAVDAACGLAEPPSEDERRRALQMYSRGSGPGFLRNVDHQRLVEGRSCDHRGLLVGEALRIELQRGRRWLALRTSEPLGRGDGLLVEGGYASEGELGGRVWEVRQRGADVERAAPGEVLVWFGPDKPLPPKLPRAGAPGPRRVFRTSDPEAKREALAAVERAPYKRPIDIVVRGVFGEPPTFSARAPSGEHAEVLGDAPVERAERAAITADVLRDKLGRLGDTPFVLGDLHVELPDGAMLPLSSINRARRALAAELVARAARRSFATLPRTHAEVLAEATLPDRAPPRGGLFVLARTLEQAEAALDAGADGVVLDFLELTGTGDAVRALRGRSDRERVHVTLAPPRIRKPGEEKIDKYLRSLEPDALLVRGLGALQSADDDPIPKIGDFSLNVTNRIAAASVLRRGLAAFTPSFDLDATQLLALLGGGLGAFAEVVVHHPMPLFHMEHCVIAALLSDGADYKTCGRPCEKHRISLRDRAGMDHPVEADVGCRNTVFHAAPQSAAALVPELQRLGVRRFRVELVREGAADVRAIVENYRALLAGERAPEDVWKRLKTQGGYGVVRGSLRVLG
jgi:putative protease